MRIHGKVLSAVTDHARAARPRECCGVLLADGQAPGTVTRALPGENEERGDPRHRFRLGRRAHLHAVELELAGQARIAGYYHSHPDGGVAPSPHDVEMAAEDSVHLIVSVQDDAAEAAAWRWTGESFVQEPLEVIRGGAETVPPFPPRPNPMAADQATP